MNALKIVAIVLIIMGSLGLGYGSFSYTQETQSAKIGSIELIVSDRQTFNVPAWTGAAMIAAGAMILLTARKG